MSTLIHNIYFPDYTDFTAVLPVLVKYSWVRLNIKPQWFLSLHQSVSEMCHLGWKTEYSILTILTMFNSWFHDFDHYFYNFRQRSNKKTVKKK